MADSEEKKKYFGDMAQDTDCILALAVKLWNSL